MTGNKRWSSNPHDVMRAQYLDWLKTRAVGPSNPWVLYFPHSDGDDDRVLDVVDSLEQSGLVNLQRSMGGVRAATVMITSAGREEVRAIRARRSDRAERAVAAREAVLDWLHNWDKNYEPGDVTVMRGEPQSYFEGDPFTDGELLKASKYLSERNLIKGIATQSEALLRLKITPEGQDCVENGEGVARYGNSPTTTGASIMNTFNQHNYGPNYGGIGQGETVNQVVNAGDPSPVLQAIQAVREALPADHQDASLIEGQLVEVEGQADSDNPNHDKVKAATGKIKRLAYAMGIVALTSAVGLLLHAVAVWAGLPV